MDGIHQVDGGAIGDIDAEKDGRVPGDQPIGPGPGSRFPVRPADFQVVGMDLFGEPGLISWDVQLISSGLLVKPRQSSQGGIAIRIDGDLRVTKKEAVNQTGNRAKGRKCLDER